jgi:hypothetical protein
MRGLALLRDVGFLIFTLQLLYVVGSHCGEWVKVLLRVPLLCHGICPPGLPDSMRLIFGRYEMKLRTNRVPSRVRRGHGLLPLVE